MIQGHGDRRAVVILNDFGTVNGGAAKVAIESAYGLAERGHRVIYFCAVGPIDQRLHERGIEIVCLDQRASLDDPSRLKGALRNLWNGAAAHRLSELLARMADHKTIVHIHGWSKALSPSCLWAVRQSGLPAVITIHDYFLACPNGALFDYRLGENCQLKPMSQACIVRHCDKQSYSMKAFRVLRQIIQDTAIARPGPPWHFAAVSEFALSKIEQFLPASSSRSVLVNPVDVTRLAPAEPARSDLFLAAGRLSPEKGFGLFAEAVKRANVRGAVIGAGECENEIVAINGSLEMLGWLEHAPMLSKLREARALVFPSLWPETQGLVPLEAAAQGIPPIVSDNTAARDRVVDDGTGLHFQSGNVAALTEQLVRLKDDGLVARLGRAAYDNYWADAPTLASHVTNLEKLYGSMHEQNCRFAKA